MARWKPLSEVGQNESVGRRLFDEPMLTGAQDQNASYDGLDLRNFEERRDGEVSLDRLGRSNIENQVVSYLLPRAHAAAAKFKSPKTFSGWFTVVVRHIEKQP